MKFQNLMILQFVFFLVYQNNNSKKKGINNKESITEKNIKNKMIHVAYFATSSSAKWLFF